MVFKFFTTKLISWSSYVVLQQVAARTHTWQHEQLRRGNWPGAQDDLVNGIDVFRSLTFVTDPNANSSARFINQYFVHVRQQRHVKVRLAMEVCVGCNTKNHIFLFYPRLKITIAPLSVQCTPSQVWVSTSIKWQPEMCEHFWNTFWAC